MEEKRLQEIKDYLVSCQNYEFVLVDIYTYTVEELISAIENLKREIYELKESK